MKSLLTILCLIAIGNPVRAQRYISESSHISFFSETPLENIEAANTQSTSLFDSSTGQLVFSVSISSFEFAKSLMREHFNESYLESDKYPKATFKGTVNGFEKKEGKQKVSATGELSIHGVVRKVTVEGIMEMNGGKIRLNTAFPVKLDDYQVKKPKVVFYNIADEIQVKINIDYKPYEK